MQALIHISSFATQRELLSVGQDRGASVIAVSDENEVLEWLQRLTKPRVSGGGAPPRKAPSGGKSSSSVSSSSSSAGRGQRSWDEGALRGLEALLCPAGTSNSWGRAKVAGLLRSGGSLCGLASADASELHSRYGLSAVQAAELAQFMDAPL